jgi:DNA processing protein
MILDAVPKLQKRTIFKLLHHYPIEQFFQLNQQQLQQCKLSSIQVSAILTPDFVMIEKHLNWICETNNKTIICFDSPAYPPLLKEISSPPLILYLQGDITLLNSAQIAMVGSRNCTPYGQNKAYQFASELVQSGFTITSGLAIGVDGYAHQGALDKNGKTIAVLGTGLNNIYPKRHLKLAQQISENGLLVSEFWPNAAAIPSNFPRRNRIISGLSLGTLVIEASLRSGSLITARYAGEQNREVFALPGSVDNPEACGCLSLIQQGAKLVMNQQDICEEFSFLPISAQNTHLEQKEKIQQKSEHPLLQYIDFHNTTLEQLLKISGLPLVTLQNQLVELEITGSISTTAEGYQRI